MKNLLSYIVLLCTSVLLACNSDDVLHPQAEMQDTSKTALTESATSKYADSLYLAKDNMAPQYSLVYALGDYSFYIEKYTHTNNTMLYVEHGHNGEMGTTLKKYFLKDGKIIMVDEMIEQMNGNGSGALYKESKTYYRNDIQYYSESRTSTSQAALQSLPYVQALSENGDHAPDMQLLNDAVNGLGKFDLAFDSITDYPNARYLVLNKDELNAYVGTLLVDKDDAFIEQLSANQAAYKGKKLDLKWEIKDGEAVYISGKLK